MSLELLQQLTQETLPVTRQQQVDIDKLRVLRAARMVCADISAPDKPQQYAHVISITTAGWQALHAAATGRVLP